MPYRRRYVSRRRARRTLSNYRIATRTSAKAQSKQIYYLNKKINRIQRLTKPEICIVERQCNAITPPSAVVNWKYASGAQSYLSPSLGSGDDAVNSGATLVYANNFARLNSFTLYGNWQYSSLTTESVPEAPVHQTSFHKSPSYSPDRGLSWTDSRCACYTLRH